MDIGHGFSGIEQIRTDISYSLTNDRVEQNPCPIKSVERILPIKYS